MVQLDARDEGSAIDTRQTKRIISCLTNQSSQPLTAAADFMRSASGRTGDMLVEISQSKYSKV